ncbi:hypothetical protein HN953_00115, partial [Candidatus Woesearchaeota archaeon]|nr:hypothetical protein [Candidatus Woesearchaeota archaeon]
MVYKKYIYKKGKKFGPYYFKSIRDKNGSVKSVYLGKKHPNYNLFVLIGVIGLALFLSLVGFAPLSNTYQWSDLNGIIVGATASTYSVTSTGTYSLTVTTPGGCTSISNGIPMTVLSTAVPSSLFTSNIELNKATMNWNSVANADHYDIRMRVQGSSSWTIALNYLYGTSQ